MEVHHHSHHPKKWKEYLTEFLMLFLAVSMGFVAENLREKHVENERSEELIQAFIIDVKENQLQLDSLIKNNQRLSSYFDSLCIHYATRNETIDLTELASSMDFWMYRFINRKTIFEQMKSSGALRYIQDKNILKSILLYEEHVGLAETRSMELETQQYFAEFRPELKKILPPSFYIIRGTIQNDYNKFSSFVNEDLHPTFQKNYKLTENELKINLHNTKLSVDQIRELSSIFYHREERIEVSLASQLGIRKEGEQLLKLLEEEHY